MFAADSPIMSNWVFLVSC